MHLDNRPKSTDFTSFNHLHKGCPCQWQQNSSCWLAMPLFPGCPLLKTASKIVFSFLSAFVNRLKSFLSNTFFIRYVYSFNQIAEMSCSLEAISTFPTVKSHYALFLGLKSQNVVLLPSLPGSGLMFHKSFQVVSINFSLDLEFHIGSVTYDQHDSISTCSFTHVFLPYFTHSIIQYILIG